MHKDVRSTVDYIGGLRVMGIDIGYRKTGMCVVDVSADRLVAAVTFDNKKADGTTAHSDFAGCWMLGEAISEFISLWNPRALFAEIPHGGGQGARAHRCMGMATAVLSEALRRTRRTLPFELYTPGGVEELLGIRITGGCAKRKGISGKGKLRAWKKQRLEEAVIGAYPDFVEWPNTVRLKEDAVDSAAAVLAGKANGKLYAKIAGTLHAESGR